MASTNGTNVNKNGRGTIANALTESEELSAPNPSVAIAYALGWAVGDASTCVKYQVFDHLVRVPELDAPFSQWNLLAHQILFRCGQLNDHLKSARADLDLSAELKTATDLLVDSPPGDVKTAVGAKSETVMELHTGILAVLWPVASPLAKSYQLGHEMEQMCATPLAEPSTTVGASVKAHNAQVHRLLTVLASRLPASAAHAVNYSLRLWSASLSAGGQESVEDLLQQGRRWHDVLAGDVSGKDLLRPRDYGAVAEGFTRRLWQIAQLVGGRLARLLVVTALGGIGLIIWGTRGAISAGIAALVATLGLAWQVTSQFFGRVGARGEERLWDAEFEWAIAYRFTILRNPPADNQLRPRSRALFIDQPTKEHLRRYKQWKRNWPDVLI